MRIPFIGKSDEERASKAKDEKDVRPLFRWGFFDRSGYVNPMFESDSREDFEKLNIPAGLKPFKYPSSDGKTYVDIYLGVSPAVKKANGELAKLAKAYSPDGIWLDAESLYTNFELSGSLIGKLGEAYQRVGEMKAQMTGEWSVTANLFLVIMVVIAGIGLFYSVGVRLFAGH